MVRSNQQSLHAGPCHLVGCGISPYTHLTAHPPKRSVVHPLLQPDNTNLEVLPGLNTNIQVARWQAGDEAAFAILYERFAPLIQLRVRRNRVWSSLRSRYQVEDVVQEAWLRVVPATRKTFTPRGPGSFLAFVGQVTDNMMIDLMRRAMTTKRGEGRNDLPLPPEDGYGLAAQSGSRGFASPTSSARCSELEALAEKLLKGREFQAWRLVELKGYAAEEAGLALHATDSAVRGLLLRSRARLAVALDSEAPG